MVWGGGSHFFQVLPSPKVILNLSIVRIFTINENYIGSDRQIDILLVSYIRMIKELSNNLKLYNIKGNINIINYLHVIVTGNKKLLKA